MSLQDQTLSSTMNKDRSFANRPKAVTQKSEKDCKVFKTISKYFSDKEWAKLGYSEKTTYVYMKRNYDTMTGLGLKTTLPAFMCRKKWATKSSGHNSDEGQDFKNKDESLQKDSVVQERKRLKIKKVMHKKPKEKNDLDPVPVALGSEQAQKQQSPPGEDSISDKQIKKIPESKKAMNSRAYILRERKNLVAYEEISDPEEED